LEDTKITEITKKLKEASKAYYNTGITAMSDQEYDNLVEELRSIDPQNIFLQTIGAPPVGKLIKHLIPMGSVSKCKDREEFGRWSEKVVDKAIRFMMQPKLDGLSCSLSYEKGILKTAALRGDGQVGEECTSKVVKMRNVKKKLSLPFTGSLRGEIMLFLKDFEEVFKPLGYRNPRNTVAGLCRDKKSDELAPFMKIIYYDICCEEDFQNEGERLEYITQTLKLETVNSYLFEDTESVWQAYLKMEELRNKMPYEADGVIVRAFNLTTQQNLGIDPDLRPKWMKCIKFGTQKVITTLNNILVSIGSDGSQVPTGQVEPVGIGGVIVSNVLLNNYDYIASLGLTLGCKLEIERSGDVIPHCTRVIEKTNKPILPPEKCIACAGPLVKVGVHWMCKNDNCDGKNMRKIKTYLGKRNIRYIGDELLTELFKNHGVKTPADLYKLTDEYLAVVPRGAGIVGSGSKLIMAEINKSKTCSLQDFMGSLCVPFLGRRFAEIMIGQGIDTLDKFLSVSVADLIKLPGFSEEGSKASEIVEGIKKVRPLIDALLKVVKIEAAPKKFAISTTCADKIIVFTGVRPTKEEEEKFAAAGGTVKSGVSKAITHLIVANPGTTSNKAQKALEYGVKVVGYQEFQGWLI
jgi:DNA ligase (NAD+)